MLARVQSYLLQGIDALPCEVEVDHDETGSEKQTIVGLPDAAVKEALERVRSALGNSGYSFPLGRLLINLAPADVKKEGPLYDLPIAVAILVATGVLPASYREASARKRKFPAPVGPGGGLGVVGGNGEAAAEPMDLRTLFIAGELALDGRLRPVRGAIALAALARSRGAKGLILPAENTPEASVVEGIEAYPARTLSEVVGLLTGQIEAKPEPPVDVSGLLEAAAASVDFVDVKGQEAVKRAIVVAAAGSHNLVQLCPSDGDGGGLGW